MNFQGSVVDQIWVAKPTGTREFQTIFSNDMQSRFALKEPSTPKTVEINAVESAYPTGSPSLFSATRNNRASLGLGISQGQVWMIYLHDANKRTDRM
jgi:hypothetical protein